MKLFSEYQIELSNKIEKVVNSQLLIIDNKTHASNFKSLTDQVKELKQSNLELGNKLSKVKDLEHRNDHLGKQFF